MVKEEVLLNSIDKAKTFVAAVSKFDCDMSLSSGRHVIDAKSILGIFSMNLLKPLTLTMYTDDASSINKEITPFLT